MGKTRIGWTDETWNPVRGCTQVSPGCANCYAKHQAARIVRMSKGKPCKYDGLVRLTKRGEPTWTGRVAFDPETLAAPLRWRTPRRVFVNSMSDLFHESLTNEQIAAVFGVMAACPQHTFQVLTKRARRMREWFEWLRGPSENTFTMQQRGIASAPNTFRALLDAAYEVLGKPSKPALDAAWHSKFAESDPWPLGNVWLGVSVENQDAADDRIHELLRTPAAIRFLSCEPLLSEVRLDRLGCGWTSLAASDRGWETPDERNRIDWVIDGCESGPGARPAKREWFREIEGQCHVAGVPYFHKQEMIDGKLVHDFPGRQEFPR